MGDEGWMDGGGWREGERKRYTKVGVECNGFIFFCTATSTFFWRKKK
jgi:hypothetical protein